MTNAFTTLYDLQHPEATDGGAQDLEQLTAKAVQESKLPAFITKLKIKLYICVIRGLSGLDDDF